MVKVGFGWTNVAVSTIWDILFYVYYVGYIAGCIAVARRWKLRAKDAGTARQANLLIASFIAALVLGSFTDVILAFTANTPIPKWPPSSSSSPSRFFTTS